MTADEHWADIAGCGGAYKVSTLGEILGVERRARTNNGWGESTRRVPAHVMTPRLHEGRAVVGICIDGVASSLTVATTVLEAFVGPRPRGYYAEFRNGDPADCRLSNLYWRKRNWGGMGRKLKTIDNDTEAV